MKYKIIGKKIKEDYKKYGAPKFLDAWIDKLDGKIVEFKENQEVAQYDVYLISKDWCESIEDVSRETICDNKDIIEKIKEYCKQNIKRIDDMTDAGFSTDVDTGICYAYGRILDLIESEEKKHD